MSGCIKAQRNTSADRWALLKAYVPRSAEVSPQAFGAWLILFAKADQRGRVTMSKADLGAKIKAPGNVCRLARELTAAGWLTFESGGRTKAGVYTLTAPTGLQGDRPPGKRRWRILNLLAEKAHYNKRAIFPLALLCLTEGRGDTYRINAGPAELGAMIGVSRWTAADSIKAPKNPVAAIRSPKGAIIGVELARVLIEKAAANCS